jgi:hypothetical protein
MPPFLLRHRTSVPPFLVQKWGIMVKNVLKAFCHTLDQAHQHAQRWLPPYSQRALPTLGPVQVTIICGLKFSRDNCPFRVRAMRFSAEDKCGPCRGIRGCIRWMRTEPQKGGGKKEGEVNRAEEHNGEGRGSAWSKGERVSGDNSYDVEKYSSRKRVRRQEI